MARISATQGPAVAVHDLTKRYGGGAAKHAVVDRLSCEIPPYRSAGSGFLVKDSDPAELLHALRVVADGGSLLSPP